MNADNPKAQESIRAQARDLPAPCTQMKSALFSSACIDSRCSKHWARTLSSVLAVICVHLRSLPESPRTTPPLAQRRFGEAAALDEVVDVLERREQLAHLRK